MAAVFITFRRYYLDMMLSKTEFRGRVLDVGGKKENKRGMFRPPVDNVELWRYLNIDATTMPDYCCSAENIPVDDEYFDIVLMNEVLEHLEYPECLLKECGRVLKRGGKIIISMPFLYPIHADPYDFQRWTPTKIKMELGKTGFVMERLETMGGLVAVIYDLLYVSTGRGTNYSISFKYRFIKRVIMPILKRIFLSVDRTFKTDLITTGYYVVGIKE